MGQEVQGDFTEAEEAVPSNQGQQPISSVGDSQLVVKAVPPGRSAPGSK